MKKLLSLLTFSLICIHCAVVEAPPGGPVDNTPPDILTTIPESNSIGIEKNSVFKITFSESMNHDLTEKAIFLSPVFWDYPTYKWSGKILTIIPPENLKDNTTYILTIGAGAIDINGNKLGKSLNMAFSTGAVIDSGSISGAVYTDDNSKTTFDIWAYMLANADSLEFWKNIPDYATQTDSLGGFNIDHLGDGNYLVVAIDDRNDDLFWDPAAEPLALPPSIIDLRSEEHIRNINLRPNRRDTTTAYISRVTPLNSQAIAIELSQLAARKAMLNSDSYSVHEVGNDSILSTGQAYFSDGDKINLETVAQIPDRLYKVSPVNLQTVWGIPFDTAGGRFTGTSIPDTVGPKLLGSFPSNKSTTAYQDSVIELTFSERLQVIGLTDNIIVTADSIEILPYTSIWIEPNVARLRFAAKIPRERAIRVEFNTSEIFDNHKNRMPDSALSFQFRLPPIDTVGEAQAILTQIPNDRVIGKLKSYRRGGETYLGLFNKEGVLNIGSIMPGSYRFEYFIDSDTNGEWSPGILEPFAPAEWFEIMPETLFVRSRWTTDIGTISVPESRR